MYMQVSEISGVGQAPAVTALPGADSPLINQSVPADIRGVWRNKNGRPVVRQRTAITQVVIHTLIDLPASAYVEKWRTGQNRLPPHYVINKSGEITQMVAEQHIAHHAGSANGNSIGIEHEGRCYDKPECFSQALYGSSAKLTRDICQRNNIPIDRAHIIGHDEVSGSTHGDPGGYWDWDYFLALVAWDGTDTNRKPIRLILDYNSLDVWPTTQHWHERQRKPRRWGPSHEQSYGPRYFWANPSSTAQAGDAVVYAANIPQTGTYKLSAWWPVFGNNNPDVTIHVSTNSPIASDRSLTAKVSQNVRSLMARRTVALPSSHTWHELGHFRLQAGNDVIIELSRRSSRRGQIVADAFRLLKV